MIFFTSIGLHEIFRDVEKSALEPVVDFLLRQVADSEKSLDFVVTDQWPHFFRQNLHIDVFPQASAVVPGFFPVVYHHCEHGIEFFAFGKLVAVSRGIVAHYPRGHVLVRPGLIFNANEQDYDFFGPNRQQFGNIAILAVDLAISLVDAGRIRVLQHFRLDDLLSLKNEPVQHVGKNFIFA